MKGLLAAFSDMPLLLKGITSFFAVYGVGSLLLAATPGLEYRVAGETLSRAEFFAAGHGRLALAMGAWLTVSAAGLLRRAAWARWAAALAYLPLALAAAGTAALAMQAGLACAFAAGTGAYLFRARGPVAFFAGARRA